VATRTVSDGAVIVDLRAASLRALGNARYRGRPVLLAALERVTADGSSVSVIVSTPQDRDDVIAAIASAAPAASVGTRGELAASFENVGGTAVWLRSLVIGLDGQEIRRLSAEHGADRARGAHPALTAIHAAVGQATAATSIAAGWVTAVSTLASLLDTGEPEATSDARATFLRRPVLRTLDDFAALLRDERRAQAEELLLKGVHLADWMSLQVDGDLDCAAGVSIGAHVAVEGHVQIDSGATIGAHTFLRNVRIGPGTEVKAFSSLEDVEVGANCRIGPYARLRGQTIIDNEVSIGNFVELKATKVGSGGRINHFAYLGDATLQPGVTIGAGVITCNHDGTKAVPTRIEAGAYVGSGTQLVAPLIVGRDSTIGAGSTITEDVAPEGLTLARARQVRVDGWKRKDRK
jgi:acyl-[acyl carrier protein]--UDP-N-acetylglucosamine O-acyltransferase